MAKKESAADKIQNLLKGNKAVPPLAEKSPKIKPPKGKHGGPRANSGGAREGSGREPLPDEEKRRKRKQVWRDFGDEEVEVIMKEKTEVGTVVERKVKMKRLRVVQEAIYKEATKGNMVAAKEFNDRVHNKSPQPLVGDMEEDPIQVNHDVLPILEKAYGNDDTDED